MRILYVTTVSITMGFFPEHFKMLIDEGHTVELACNSEIPVPQVIADMGLKVHNISFSRSPFSKSNVEAIEQLRQLVENGKFDIVHTHTPNASAIVRLACRKLRKQGLKVFYTAHGFHFYKGAPIKNWLVYYPVEWICAHWTDKLITINNEDYALAKKRMHANEVVYVPGVGIDLRKFGHSTVDKVEKRKELGIPQDATLLISVGELNDNKNHETVIKAIKGLDVYYLIAGQGNKRDELQCLIDSQGMSDRIFLLGFRNDIQDLYEASDIYVFPSFREGLSVALMEAMACGLSCVASKIRGNTDLIDERGGVLFNPLSTDACKESIEKCIVADRSAMGVYNKQKIHNFSSETVLEEMKSIYKVK